MKLWSKAGEELQTLQGHGDRVWSVAFSPDGETLATASFDNTVKLWSKAGEDLQTLPGHGDGVFSVAFSPDGETLATASADNTVKLWNLQLEDLIVRGCNWLGTYFVKQSPELLMELEVCQENDPSLMVAAAPTLVTQGEALARTGQSEQALDKFRLATTWDDTLDLEALRTRGEALALIFEGRQLMEDQNFDAAIEKFQDSQTLLPDLDPSPDSAYGPWNALCWEGALAGYAAKVMFACQQAVGLAPDQGGIIDSRGLARALTGDTQGAIADFQAFVEWTSSEEQKAQRQGWIEALERGENPFTPEVLEALQNE